jgi:hypothetical protein
MLCRSTSADPLGLVMLKRTLPDWDDKEGVTRLADELITEVEARAQRFIDYGDRVAADEDDRLSDEDAHWPAADRKKLAKFIQAERAAVEAAECGNPAPLNDLLDEYADCLDWFKRETLRLASELNKPKKRGGQKKTRDQRLEAVVTHRAAANFQLLWGCLRELYPNVRAVRKRGIDSVRERAIEIAAARAKVNVGTLTTYVNRSRKARQRLI